MADRVAERGLFAPQNFIGQPSALLERLAQEIFALSGAVAFLLRVDAHDVIHERKVAERHARFDAVVGDAAVGPQHIICVQLAHALLALLLKRLGRGGKVGVLVAEQLVGHFARQKHAHVGVLTDGLAQKIHAHACAHGGDVVCAEDGDDLLQSAAHLLRRHVEFRVLRAQILCRLACILEVDGVPLHADGKGADGLFQDARGDGADQRAVEPARQKKAQRSVGVEAFFHARDKALADARTDLLLALARPHRCARGVAEACELAVRVKAAGRERMNFLHPTDKAARLAGERNAAFCIVAVEQRADADGVARGHKAFARVIVQNARKFRVEHTEHVRAHALI